MAEILYAHFVEGKVNSGRQAFEKRKIGEIGNRFQFFYKGVLEVAEKQVGPHPDNSSDAIACAAWRIYLMGLEDGQRQTHGGLFDFGVLV